MSTQDLIEELVINQMKYLFDYNSNIPASDRLNEIRSILSDNDKFPVEQTPGLKLLLSSDPIITRKPYERVKVACDSDRITLIHIEIAKYI